MAASEAQGVARRNPSSLQRNRPSRVALKHPQPARRRRFRVRLPLLHGIIAAVHAPTVWIQPWPPPSTRASWPPMGWATTPSKQRSSRMDAWPSTTATTPLPASFPKPRPASTVRRWWPSAGCSGHDVLLVRLPRVGPRVPSEEVWIAERSAGGDAQVIWWGTTGALDPDGEVTGAAEVDDTAIRVYRTVARLSRCDGLPVRLALMTWDFTDHTFKPVRPALPPLAPVTIKAHRGGAPEGRPQGGFFFSAASSSPGAASDPSRLRPPVALNDGDATTLWSSEGDARGQLLTARSSAGFAITGLRLLPRSPSTLRLSRRQAAQAGADFRR